MLTKGDQDVSNGILSFYQYDYVECMLATYILHDATKLICNLSDAVSRLWICLKAAPWIIVDHTIEGTPFWNVATGVTKSNTAFCMTILKPSILYYANSDEFLADASSNIAIQ
ncbi:hypothetical protein TNCV_3047951 [Trichonephila clavipes]|nr:hypothetical protein TNCV_3047951 [Trichonephila clavipes]